MQEIITIIHRAAAAAHHEPLVAVAARQMVDYIAHMSLDAFKSEFPRLAQMAGQVQAADARLERERVAGRPLQGWVAEVRVHLEPLGHEVVALALGDEIADRVAALDAVTFDKRHRHLPR